MAKKKRTTTSTTSTTGNYHLIKATAFWGVIISGIATLISLIVKMILVIGFDNTAAALNRVVGIFNLIATLALYISVLLAGYAHSVGKPRVWRTLFLVFAIIAVLGLLGINVWNMF